VGFDTDKQIFVDEQHRSGPALPFIPTNAAIRPLGLGLVLAAFAIPTKIT